MFHDMFKAFIACCTATLHLLAISKLGHMHSCCSLNDDLHIAENTLSAGADFYTKRTCFTAEAQ